MKVGHVLVGQFRVLGQMHIFLCHHDALFEEELIDGNTVLLGHQHLFTQPTMRQALVYMQINRDVHLPTYWLANSPLQDCKVTNVTRLGVLTYVN